MCARSIVPSSEYEQAFLAMLDDFDRNDPRNADSYAPAKQDFLAYVQGLLDAERGVNLAQGWVPCAHRWLLTSTNEIVGVARLRHRINTPFLSAHGGHIGYDVAPSARGRGYGHLALSTAILEARRLGMGRVLIYTSVDNAASRAVVETAGGILERIAYSEFWNEHLCMYWLAVAAQG
jgi:predicted acetyltransferase